MQITGKRAITTLRDSNMELLRIVCMLMITIHHTMTYPGMYYSGIFGNGELVPKYELAVFLNGLCFVGVNCFVLISGLYGIKFKWKSLFSLWLLCAFYVCLSSIANHFMYGSMWHVKTTIDLAVHSFTRGSWFIPCYVYLYLLAPILNFARDYADKKQYVFILILLTIGCYYMGYWRWCSQFDLNGFTVGHFIWLYFIGGFIGRFGENIKSRIVAPIALTSYLTFSFLWGLLTNLQLSGYSLYFWHPSYYNSMCMMLAAVSLVIFMYTFKFSSLIINKIAKSVLAVYLFADVLYVKIGEAMFAGDCPYGYLDGGG